MLDKLWKFLNAPIVILAIIILVLVFVVRPSIYGPSVLKDGPPLDLSATSRMGGAYYGYLGTTRYESVVQSNEVMDTPEWEPSLGEPPLSPAGAITAIRSTLVDMIPGLANMPVYNVTLERVAPRHFIYIVAFSSSSEFEPTVGLRLVALMDGTVIRPSTSSTQD